MLQMRLVALNILLFLFVLQVRFVPGNILLHIGKPVHKLIGITHQKFLHLFVQVFRLEYWVLIQELPLVVAAGELFTALPVTDG